VVESIEKAPEAPAVPEDEDGEDAVKLDPKDSERQYWTDPVLRLQREIWRPGDGDGDKATDYYEKPGKIPLDKRWRFYQSRTGVTAVKSNLNEPPKYVILDDRAAQECVSSDIPRQYLGKFWGHDFSNSGIIRSRRPHRGRPAIGDADAPGHHKYHFARIGTKGERYYFTGEKDYTPILYLTADPKLAIDVFKPPQSVVPPSSVKPALPANKHGHNQFTPKDQMVRYGAAHKGTSWMRYSKRVNKFLTREKTPPTGARGGLSTLYARDPAEASARPSVQPQYQQSSYRDTVERERLWMDEEDERPVKRRMLASMYEPSNVGGDEDEEKDKELEDGPSRQRSHSSRPVGPFLNSSDDEDEGEAGPTPPPRKKLDEQPDLFAELSTGQQANNEVVVPPPVPTAVESYDSGSYATQLEAELAAAKKTIEEQKSEIEAAEVSAEQQKNQIETASMVTEQQKDQIAELQKSYEEAQAKTAEQAGEIVELKGKLYVSTGGQDSEMSDEVAENKIPEQMVQVAEVEGQLVVSGGDGDGENSEGEAEDKIDEQVGEVAELKGKLDVSAGA